MFPLDSARHVEYNMDCCFTIFDNSSEKEMGHHLAWQPIDLVLFFTRFFPAALARQCFLHTLLLARLQVKGVTLDLLNDVFLLHLALEAA